MLLESHVVERTRAAYDNMKDDTGNLLSTFFNEHEIILLRGLEKYKPTVLNRLQVLASGMSSTKPSILR